MTVSCKFSFMQSSLHNRPHFDTIMIDFDKSKLLHNPNKKVEEVAPVETGVDSSKKEKEVAKDVKVTKKSAVTKTKKK